MGRRTWSQGIAIDTTYVPLLLQNIHAGWVAAGWTQTSDTGQVNTSTYNGTASPSVYEIWRMNDSIQATYPIFVKMEYQSSGGTAMRLKFSIGTGSDGAGALTGNLFSGYDPFGLGAGIFYAVHSNLATAAEDYFMAGDGSGVAYAGRVPNATTSARGGIFIDRMRNADGTPNANGLVLGCTGGNGSSWAAMYARSTSRASSIGISYLGPGLSVEFPWHSGGTSMERTGGVAPVIPIRFFTPEVNYLRMVVMLSSDAGYPAVISTDHLGVANTDFLAVGTYLGSPWYTATTGAPTLGLYYDA